MSGVFACEGCVADGEAAAALPLLLPFVLARVAIVYGLQTICSLKSDDDGGSKAVGSNKVSCLFTTGTPPQKVQATLIHGFFKQSIK